MNKPSPLEQLKAATTSTVEAFELIERASRDSNHNHISDEIAKDKKRVSDGIYIAIVGAFSSGKTTFVNALLGEELLPTSATPTTATITEIYNDPSRTVSIILKTEELLKEEQVRAVERTEELKSISDRTAAQNTELNQLRAVVDINPNFTYPGGLPAKFELDKLSDRKTIDRFLAEGPYSLAVYTERVIFRVPMDPELMPENVVIVDTPGSNSFSYSHRNATYRALSQSDCVLFFLNANAPLSMSDLELLEDVNTIREQHDLKKDRFIFIANAIDEIDPEMEDREKILEYIVSRLEDNGVKNPHVLGVSSLVAFLSRLYSKNSTLTRRQKRLLLDESDDNPENGWEASAASKVLDLLWSTIGRESSYDLLSEALERGKSRLHQLNNNNKVQLNSLELNESVDRALGFQESLLEVIKQRRLYRETFRHNLVSFINDELLNHDLHKSNELQKRLIESIGSLRNKSNIGSRLGIETRKWVQSRLLEIESHVNNLGVIIQNELSKILNIDLEEGSIGFSNIEPIRFNILFDIPPIENNSNGSVGGSTSAGAVIGGIIGLIAGGPFGALMGGGIGAAIFGSVASNNVKEQLASLRNKQNQMIAKQASAVEAPLRDYLIKCKNALMDQALGEFDGYLNDMENQLNYRVQIARNAQRDFDSTQKKLIQQRELLLECESLLKNAEKAVHSLK